jgi:predicted enzyme related to lactoylglutathione lyase
VLPARARRHGQFLLGRARPLHLPCAARLAAPQYRTAGETARRRRCPACPPLRIGDRARRPSRRIVLRVGASCAALAPGKIGHRAEGARIVYPTTPRFVWHELMTTDAAAATAFYQSVIGWNTADAGMATPYTILMAGKTPIGGLMPMPESARAMAAPPGWLGYIGVDDIEARAARIVSAGGALHRPIEPIPGVGRFAVMADAQGAVFVLFQANEGSTMTEAPEGTPGLVGWNELRAAEWHSGFAFYEQIFGWTRVEEMDMGPAGTYLMFATGAKPVGGVANLTPPMRAPHWGYYFNVEAIDAAMQRVERSGGQVLHGPHEVPGGSWIAGCVDPQGAHFDMVAPRR